MNRISSRLDQHHRSMRPQRFAVATGSLEFDRQAHFRRSLKMTLLTLAIGLAMFALFFGLVAACERF